MKIFLKKVFIFSFSFGLLLLVGILLPTTPEASKSLLFAFNHKDSLLNHAPSPRLIMVGGSNLSFGIDSQLIKDSLQVFPVNMGIHASLGLRFMMNSVLSGVKEGDIVLLIPEYNHFFESFDKVSEELLRVILDVNYNNGKYLSNAQKIKLIKYLPKYAASKFNPTDYINYWESDIYSVSSFNSFGDVYKHWGMTAKDFLPISPLKDFNPVSVKEISEFSELLASKGAKLLLSFPSLHDQSFEENLLKIQLVYSKLNAAKLKVISDPQDYSFPESMMFDTPYHLNYEGLKVRTQQLIFDLNLIMEFED